MRISRLSAALAIAALAGLVLFLLARPPGRPAESSRSPHSADPAAGPPRPAKPLPGEILMQAYADPSTDPIEDLRALDRVLTGYFSIIKDHRHHPIGGNQDLAAALRGENAGRQAFLPDNHPAFDSSGRLIDRWGSPVFVHPLAARQIELRFAGPDRAMFTDDDLELRPR